MKVPRHKRTWPRSSAFTRLELAITVLLVALIAFVALSMRKAVRLHADPVECGSNLTYVGLALRIWANDHGDKFPTMVSTNLGGSQEYAETGQVFRHYLSLSNQLGSPLKLVCPADSRRASRDWASLANANVSYFINLDAEDRDEGKLLVGDRHLDGKPSKVGSMLVLTTNTSLSWGPSNHGERFGNLVLVDGSVHGVYTPEFHAPELTRFVQKSLTGAVSNRLEFP